MTGSLSKMLACVLRRGDLPWLSGLTALRTFREAARSVPAYRDLLARLHVPVDRITSLADFQARVPVVDEHTYLSQYPLDLLCRGGTFAGSYTIERTPESATRAMYHVRGEPEERRLREAAESLLCETLHADRRPTLALVAWSQRTWPFGEQLARALHDLARRRRMRVTVITPGTRLTDCLDALRTVLPRFDQALLAGSATLLEEIAWRMPGQPLHLLVGGAISESWRRRMQRRLGARSSGASRPLVLCCGGATAQPFELGFETPAAALLRRLAAEDARLCRDLFRGCTDPPHVLQANPLDVFTERIDGELVITARGTTPLVRFHLHRPGGTLTFAQARAILRDHGWDLLRMLTEAGWRPHTVTPFPFVYAGPQAVPANAPRMASPARPLAHTLTMQPALHGL